jgi:hypothetical protein
MKILFHLFRIETGEIETGNIQKKHTLTTMSVFSETS